MKPSWVAIFGNAEISADEINFVPKQAEIAAMTPAPDSGSQTPPPHAVLRSNIIFEQGKISFQLKIGDQSSRCQIGLKSAKNGEMYSGINVLGTAFGFGCFINGNWEPVTGTGQSGVFVLDQWHDIRLQVQGSNITLYFNEVEVCSTTHQLLKGPVSLLLQGDASVNIRQFHVEQKSPICFVVMQFTDEFNTLFSEVIKPTLENFGYTVVRADDFHTSGMILDDITRSIREASVVIADVTPDNPNVFYEVGYAHGINKTTILLSDRSRERLPFDISGFRTIFYDNTIGGKGAVETRLRKHLENIGT